MEISKRGPDYKRLIVKSNEAAAKAYADAAMHVCYSRDKVAVSDDRHVPALGTTLSTPTTRLCIHA